MAKISIDLKSGQAKKDSDIIIGIDLGTTNSLVAYIKDGQPFAVKDKDQKNTLVPSIIHFNAQQKVIVGTVAKEKLITDPANTIYSVKRLMGKSFDDLKHVKEYLGYEIIDEDTDSLVKIRVNDRFYSPIELSAEILKELKRRIEAQIQAGVSKAVITVPAYFNDTQRQATRDAGKLAGLDVLRIVNEPTAASLAYGIGLGQEYDGQKIAVYDLGGGTFDISILSIEEGVFEVLSTNGDTFLGGDDFDRLIVDFWIKDQNLASDKLSSDKSFSQKIRLAAEEAKKHLGTNAFYKNELDGIPLRISKNTFEQLAKSLIFKTITACENALTDAKLSPENIDHIVMVGGSTRIPLVRQSVASFFGKDVYDKLNPDEVVALGAAIQADVLAGNQKDILLLDVTPLSLGIETVGGLMDVIIPRNNKVPSKAGRQYTTSVDGQKNLKVAIFQGERDLVEHNRKLGEFVLRDIPPMPAGLPKIEVNFYLDADGILKVKAAELRSNVAQEIEIRSQYGISEEEMARMLIDSIQHAESDMKIKALLEARNEANNILLSSTKFIQQNGTWLSKEQVQQIELLAENLKQTTTETDKDAINAAMEDLNKYTAPLAHEAMDRNIGEALKNKDVNS